MGKKSRRKKNEALGMLAEFENPGELLHAAEKMRDAGFKKFDCHSPFPIHGMDDAMGMKQSRLGYIVFLAAAAGGSGGFLLQAWVATTAYPLVISGKPFLSGQAFVPVTFEMTILLAAFGAVFGMFHLNKLPQWYNNLFYSDRFEKVTDDGFFVSVEAEDEKFDERKTREFLESIGAQHVEVLRETES